MIHIDQILIFVIVYTVSISIFLFTKININGIISSDGIIALLGWILGLFITFLNIKYSNNYLITLGPLLSLTSLTYLLFRNKIHFEDIFFEFNIDYRKKKLLDLIFWFCILLSLFSYYYANPYMRPPLFFIIISLGVASLGMNILMLDFSSKLNIYIIFLKIFLLSILLRASAYFLSPFPIGSDPWVHSEYIRYFLSFHQLKVPEGILSYYCNYPIFHLISCLASMLMQLTIKESLFIHGIILSISTIFIFLFIREATKNNQLALLSMLMVNFSDFHLQWSIEIIAMSFGITLYTIILYFIIRNINRKTILSSILLIIFLMLIIWTHTISSFITLINFVCIYIGLVLYSRICKLKYPASMITYSLPIFFFILIVYHWMDPNYPFLDSIIVGLDQAISIDAKFLGRTPAAFLEMGTFGILSKISNIVGFLIYASLAIMGVLYSLHISKINSIKFSLFISIITLYFIFFVFPLMGVRNIVPYRWPVFIYISSALFISYGIFIWIKLLDNKKKYIIFVILFISTFFMITNSFCNMDSPIYGAQFSEKLVFTESEIALMNKINSTYDGKISSDLQTTLVVFNWLLHRSNSSSYWQGLDENIAWSSLKDGIIIWRKVSLIRPIQIKGPKNPQLIPGNEFKLNLDKNNSCIFDTGDARAYL